MKDKKIKDTKIGAFLKDKAPNVLSIVGDLLPDSGAIGIDKNAIDMMTPDPKERAKLQEEISELELEYYRLEVQDRDSARNRQVEMAKTGESDWMMWVVGLVGIGSFALIVGSAIFMELPENPLLHQIVGLVEGVALTIFAFYFGTSKGSKDKDKK
jgi:hypothetical protein